MRYIQLCIQMNNLPPEIIQQIYYFDSTYRDYYDENILPFIKRKHIFSIGQTYGFIVTPEKYSSEWNQISCIVNHHEIVLSKPYGVVGKCKNCKHKQFYNWKR